MFLYQITMDLLLGIWCLCPIFLKQKDKGLGSDFKQFSCDCYPCIIFKTIQIIFSCGNI